MDHAVVQLVAADSFLEVRNYEVDLGRMPADLGSEIDRRQPQMPTAHDRPLALDDAPAMPPADDRPLALDDAPAMAAIRPPTVRCGGG